MAKPATSCHLKYELTGKKPSHQWTIQCSVEVEKSVDGTFFMVTGFGPGGYSGIQQLRGGKRVAIFSLWNNDTTSVEFVDSGPGVEVSKFGGEGTGLKSMRDLDWTENSTVTFRVRGKVIGGYWYCDCQLSVNKGPWEHMATYKRSIRGGPILNSTGFYSFVEDFHRGSTDQGWEHVRKAKFLRPTFTDERGVQHNLEEASFTKQEEGSDAFAKDYALAFAHPYRSGYVMQTGQETMEVEAVCQNWTKLRCKHL